VTTGKEVSKGPFSGYLTHYQPNSPCEHPQKMRLFLIRHAESVHNIEKAW
jgi:hypothetical protein